MDQKPEARTLTYDTLDNPKTDSLLQADDPMQLLKGISDMFVNYEPSLRFDNQLEFGQVKRSKLNIPFSPCSRLGPRLPQHPQQVRSSTCDIPPRVNKGEKRPGGG